MVSGRMRLQMVAFVNNVRDQPYPLECTCIGSRIAPFEGGELV